MNAKKSLSQNFLRNQYLAEQIVALADLHANDFVLEIGPGQGILTEIIAEKMTCPFVIPAKAGIFNHGNKIPHQVRNDKNNGLFLAVEKDWALAEKLKKKYHGRKNVKIICADVLEIADELAESLGANYKLISNLPYNISNLILNRFYFYRSPASSLGTGVPSSSDSGLLRARAEIPPLAGTMLSALRELPERIPVRSLPPPRTAVLMVQREVAERLVAKPGEKARGIPTVLLENVAETKMMINHIKPGAFSPAPAVESTVLKIIRKEKIGELNPAVVKAGFSAKRQKLANSLSRGLKIPKDEISAIMKETEINLNLRAEELTINQWRLISAKLASSK